jgi:DNA-binding LacI/PurR family transcriptional regulator
MFDVPNDRRPDALFVANDHMAFVAMDVIRHELGLSIPGEVSVVGFDDVPLAAWLSYNLTTVRQRAKLMVEETPQHANWGFLLRHFWGEFIRHSHQL